MGPIERPPALFGRFPRFSFPALVCAGFSNSAAPEEPQLTPSVDAPLKHRCMRIVKKAMKMGLPIFLLFPFQARNLYRNGLRKDHWPPKGEQRYSFRVDSYSRITLHDHHTGRPVELPTGATKLSWPIRDSIRFSQDGHYLLIPYEKTDFSIEAKSFFLRVWDIRKGAFIRTVRIQKNFLAETNHAPT